MTSWRLLYENRFPANAETGATVLDFSRAAEGTESVQTGPVFLLFSGFRGLGIGEGRNLTYRPADSLQGVIGLDVTIDLGVIVLIDGRPLTLFSTGTPGLSATLLSTGPPAAGGQLTCRLTVRLADAQTTVEGLRFRGRLGPQALERRRLQIRWSTNGQLQVWLDELLLAYENAFKPGHRFALSQLSIGDVAQPLTGVVNAAVTNARVVELRDDSAVASLGEQLNPEYVTPISERCEKVARATLEQLLRDARALMAAFNASSTAPWRQPDGGNPFTLAALTAHRAGGRAGVAFSRYLRDGTAESRGTVLANLKSLLQTLASDQPALFKQLVAKADEARKALDDGHCKEAVYDIRAANPKLFEKLEPLGAEVEALIDSLGGR